MALRLYQDQGADTESANVPASLCSQGTGRDGDILERSAWSPIWCWQHTLGFCQRWDVVPEDEEQR